jgi:hypothetical protein
VAKAVHCAFASLLYQRGDGFGSRYNQEMNAKAANYIRGALLGIGSV